MPDKDPSAHDDLADAALRILLEMEYARLLKIIMPIVDDDVLYGKGTIIQPGQFK